MSAGRSCQKMLFISLWPFFIFLLPPLTMKLIQSDLKMTEGHIFVYYVKPFHRLLCILMTQ